MFFELYNQLIALESRNRDSLLSPSEITALVRSQITNPTVKVITRRSDGVDMETVSIGGIYDSHNDDEDEPSIELYVIYNTEQQHTYLRLLNWNRVSFDIAEALGHEQVHRQQHKRKLKIKAYSSTLDKSHCDYQDQKYLGENHEIEAYGFSIAAELAVYHEGNIALLDEPVTGIMMWDTYTRVFALDQSVVLKLRKQVIKYLNKLQVELNVKTTNK